MTMKPEDTDAVRVLGSLSPTQLESYARTIDAYKAMAVGLTEFVTVERRMQYVFNPVRAVDLEDIFQTPTTVLRKFLCVRLGSIHGKLVVEVPITTTTLDALKKLAAMKKKTKRLFMV